MQKTITADELEIACLDAGPAAGPVVLLLHGWPDDATTWDQVVPFLTAKSYRTITRRLRGFGNKKFRKIILAVSDWRHAAPDF